jgi:hypothetical protein
MEQSTKGAYLYEDAEYFNAIANHPKVRPNLLFPDAGPVDVAPLFTDGQNVGIRTAHGGFILLHIMHPDPTSWRRAHEVHAFFPPQPDRLNAANADADDMHTLVFIGDGSWNGVTDFRWLDAEDLFAFVPVDNVPTNAYVASNGYENTGVVLRDGVEWNAWKLTKEAFTAKHEADILGV